MAEKTPDDREPFVSRSDRPEVAIKSDTPIGELRVRDLATLLGGLGTGKDFWDGKDWQKDDFDGPGNWKPLVKDLNDSKRWTKELKVEKIEKIERFEIPDQIKRIIDNLYTIPQGGFGPDPRMEQVVEAISGLARQVSQLADQVAELQKQGRG